jgi:hypothetical protein
VAQCHSLTLSVSPYLYRWLYQNALTQQVEYQSCLRNAGGLNTFSGFSVHRKVGFRDCGERLQSNPDYRLN